MRKPHIGNITAIALTAVASCAALQAGAVEHRGAIIPVPVENVTVSDGFWTPRYDGWRNVTIPDVFNKFEGKNTGNDQGDTFTNFDDVAAGKRDTGKHVGAPWFDGLVYETIRGVADFLKQKRDPALPPATVIRDRLIACGCPQKAPEALTERRF